MKWIILASFETNDYFSFVLNAFVENRSTDLYLFNVYGILISS
jgi:hypothetical protein